MERNSKRRRDALAKIEPIQSVSKDRANAATNQRKKQDDYKEFPNSLEESTTEKESRKHRYQDAQDAVIHRDRFSNPVDSIHTKADDNRRQVTAEHSRKHGA